MQMVMIIIAFISGNQLFYNQICLKKVFIAVHRFLKGHQKLKLTAKLLKLNISFTL